jgi:pimeloyl-ACP methyl ester carboxylesterase
MTLESRSSRRAPPQPPICLHIEGLGTAYRPDAAGRCPAVMILHGSEGGAAGWSHLLAVMLAARGFLAYPKSYSIGGDVWQAGDILRVPIDATADASQRLRHCKLANGRAGVYGVSRGAERALLLAVLMSQAGMDSVPDAVAAQAGADKIHPPYLSRAGTAGIFLPPDIFDKREKSTKGPATAWVWRGDGLPTGAAING